MPLTDSDIIERDFHIMTARVLIHNGALLRTIIENQMILMKALKVVNPDTISNDVNEAIKQNTIFMEEALKNDVPLFRHVNPPLKD